MRYCLAIDVGASSGRHILCHLENGKIITEEIYRFSNGPKEKLGYDGKTHLVWDHENLFCEILNGLKKAKEIGKIPQSVAIDTWGVDYALLDENDEEIGDLYCYRDSRTEAIMEQVHKLIPMQSLYEKTGILCASYNTIYQLYDDKVTGRLDKAKSFLNLPDYFHFRLTGIKRQEYTMATTTGMVNTLTHTWDDEIIQKLGFNKHLFSSLSMPGTEVGYFSKKIQSIVGYSAKVILPATHDTASAVLAAPLDGQTPYISSGTWSLLGVEQDIAHTDKGAMDIGYSNEGGALGGFRFQKNIMGLWMIQQVRHEFGDKYSFAELAEMAVNEPIDALLNVNDQRFLAPKSMTNEILNAVGQKLTVGQIAYCIFNSLAQDYHDSLVALESITGKKYQTLNIIGGGSKNQLLNKLTKQKTGKRIITGPAEGTALGNLLMQMISAGQIKNVHEGRKLIASSFDVNEVN